MPANVGRWDVPSGALVPREAEGELGAIRDEAARAGNARRVAALEFALALTRLWPLAMQAAEALEHPRVTLGAARMGLRRPTEMDHVE